MVSKAKSWLVFAIFLPFIGIVRTLGQFGRKVAVSAIGHAVQSVFFQWRPIEAYLAGRKKGKEAREKNKEKKVHRITEFSRGTGGFRTSTRLSFLLAEYDVEMNRSVRRKFLTYTLY